LEGAPAPTGSITGREADDDAEVEAETEAELPDFLSMSIAP
jgi:hypothetical protein